MPVLEMVPIVASQDIGVNGYACASEPTVLQKDYHQTSHQLGKPEQRRHSRMHPPASAHSPPTMSTDSTDSEDLKK